MPAASETDPLASLVSKVHDFGRQVTAAAVAASSTTATTSTAGGRQGDRRVASETDPLTSVFAKIQDFGKQAASTATGQQQQQQQQQQRGISSSEAAPLSLDHYEIRSLEIYLGLGERNAWTIEMNATGPVQQRIKNNLNYFRMNYVLQMVVLFGLTTVTNFVSLWGSIVLAGAWFWLLQTLGSENTLHPSSETITLFGRPSWQVSQKHAVLALVSVTCLFFLFLVEEFFWYVLLVSGFFTLLHAWLRNASIHWPLATDSSAAGASQYSHGSIPATSIIC